MQIETRLSRAGHAASIRQIIAAVACGATGIVGYGGSLAIYVWSIVLIFEHWGRTWGFISLLVPTAPFLVLFTCISWGVWYYLLGFLVCGVSIGITHSLAESRPSPLRSFLSITFVAVGLSAFVIIAVNDPRITKAEMRAQAELDDAAVGIVATIHATARSRNDPDLATSLIATKAELRKYISSLSDGNRAALAEKVRAYFRWYQAFETDIRQSLENAVNGDRFKLVISPGTQQLEVQLSAPLRSLIKMDGSLDKTLKAAGIDLGEQPKAELEKAAKLMDTLSAADWPVYEQAFQNLFGIPMAISVR